MPSPSGEPRAASHRRAAPRFPALGGWEGVVSLAIGAALVVVVGLNYRVICGTPQLLFSKYPRAAEQLLAGQLSTERLGDFSPGYLGLLVGAQWLGLGVEWVLRLQWLLHTAAAALVGGAAGRLAGRWAALAAAGLALVARPALVNAGELEPETLLLFFTAAVLWSLTRESPGVGGLAGAGLLLGLSVWVRPTALATLGAVVAVLGLRSARGAFVLFLGAAPPVLGLAGAAALITGTVSIMDPGPVLFEGNGPLATGYTGVQPQIVSDLGALEGVPDPIHIAYRKVASLDIGRSVDRDEANRFWRAKVFEFWRRHPAVAVARLARKLAFVALEYDSWDTLGLEVRAEQVDTWYRIGFAWLVPLGVAGLVLMRGQPKWRALAMTVGWAAGPVLAYVSGRQRNPLLPLLAFAGGIAIVRVATRSDRRVRLLAVAAVLLLHLILRTDYRWQEEDHISWQALQRSAALVRRAAEHPEQAEALLAEAATWNSGVEPTVRAATLRAAATSVLRQFEDPPSRFDAALALLRAGDDEGAERALADLQAEGYQPQRGPRATSSVAFYRAMALFRLGRRSEGVTELAIAAQEAVGDPDVLAAETVVAALGGQEGEAARARSDLFAFHDASTASLALGRAELRLGDERFKSELEALVRRVPQWSRARRLLESASGRSLAPEVGR